MKPGPEKGRHANPGGVWGRSSELASGERLGEPKLRLSASARQAGLGTRSGLFWLRLLVGLAALTLIFSRIDLRAATVRPTPLLVAAVMGATGLLFLSQAAAALRWRQVLGDDLLPWSYLVRLYMIGSFFGLFLPTSVGGDAVRAMATARSSERPGRAVLSVLIDRALGVVAIVGIGAVGFILAPKSLVLITGVEWRRPGISSIGLVLVAGAVALVIVSRTPRVQALWHDGLGALSELSRSPRRLYPALALAVLSQTLIVSLWYTLARGVNFILPASTFLWAVPLVSLSAMLPLTIAGLGVREGVWLALLAGSGIPSADILVFSLLYFVCNLLVAIAGGIQFVLSGLTLARPGRFPA